MASVKDEKRNTSGPDLSVGIIEDPFQIKTLEITEAQNDPDELDLDEDLELSSEESSDELLDKLSHAMQAEAQSLPLLKSSEPNAEDLARENAEDAAEILASQIAEDQALEAELAKEEAEEIDEELKAALPQIQADGSLDLNEVQSCIETLLFLADKPMSIEKIRDLLGPDFSLSIFQEATTSLVDRYQSTHHGIELVQIAGGFQFRTKVGRSALAKKLARVRVQRLSSGAMESLAIVAYRQPVMKEDIDKVRGVDSSYFIRGLLDRKLIRISGRSELPGRPMLYSTTDEFLEIFGLKDLNTMPSLREIEEMIPTSQTRNPEDEDPRVKEMRKLVSQMKSDTSTTLKYDPKEDEKILKDIRERVNAIPTSTPSLDEQKALEKAEKQAKAEAGEPPADLEAAAAEAAVATENLDTV